LHRANVRRRRKFFIRNKFEAVMLSHPPGIAGLPDDTRAVTALEYGIIASILGLVLVTIFKSFGTTLTTLFSHVGTSI
jgi:Flp pilus assembly pilin Flp